MVQRMVEIHCTCTMIKMSFAHDLQENANVLTILYKFATLKEIVTRYVEIGQRLRDLTLPKYGSSTVAKFVKRFIIHFSQLGMS